MGEMTLNVRPFVRQIVREAYNIIANPKNESECVEYLQRIQCLLPARENALGKLNMSQEDIVTAQEEFAENHYVRFLDFLVKCLSVDWLSNLPKDKIPELFDTFFLDGIPEEAFLILTSAIQTLSHGYKLNKCAVLLEEFIKQHKLRVLLWNQCVIIPDKSRTKENQHSVMWDDLVTTLAMLPERIINKTKQETSDIFYPQNYGPFLANEMLVVLHQVYSAVKNGSDVSLSFFSQLLGKLCITGSADWIWSVLLPSFTTLTNQDFIWCRICERLVCEVPDRCIESTIIPVVRDAAWYGTVNKLLGDAVLSKQKLKYLFTNKLLLYRHFKQDLILQNIVGHLASSHTRKPLFIQVLQTLLEVWGDSSAVKHTAYEQHHYISRAILIGIGLLSDRDKEQHKGDLIRKLMTGVQCHIDNQAFKVRLLGMVVAEALTTALDPKGPKLEFEYEKTEEVNHLLSLVTPPSDPGLVDIQRDFQTVTLAENDSEVKENCSTKEQEQIMEAANTEELDSDDDLEPYDMSNDAPVTKTKAPRYVRDCMEGLISSDDPERVESCLCAAADLIRSNPVGLKEIAVEFIKILLHLQDSFTLLNFISLRHSAMVALGVSCPVEVSAYLTKEFYRRNYNIRQRMDMLEVLRGIAKELSQPFTVSHKNCGEKMQPKPIQILQENKSNDIKPEDWREVVQRRIEAKTHRFAKGPKATKPEALPNRFAPVAGDFFFPLLNCFDRNDLPFDLLGEDCLLLGRLLYTLGIVVYAATNAPIAKHMGKSLLEFTWGIRYHPDRSILQAVLFAVSMAFLALPPHVFITELQTEVVEVRQWLEDLSEKSVDSSCQKQAAQTLLLVQHILSQELSKMAGH
ncbi:telomere length regulation protein TEL2 homolog isoform X2 [Lingula anatina]|uniref:Telomere length regulation protein TEL2 homolog isoform X2 n=1 Tax=Lingula anatina TaxID=7574 RepID=A0A1S3IXT8_LINAN|nr:telomere length regulation protein TEL2 homolog isoform X2 [Lingula anatina]|eukprot:XP_013402364.1 telomere length regulation protein TEL2 homolog isoform X2 [Lingula anatina]